MDEITGVAASSPYGLPATGPYASSRQHLAHLIYIVNDSGFPELPKCPS